MAAPKTVTWPIDDHTRAKHEILRRYLEAWLPIMTRFNDRIVYIDGFAGPGEYSDGENGSPLIAIDVFLRHSYALIHQKEVLFLFIEQDPKRCEHLKQLLAHRRQGQNWPPKATYEVVPGNFDETMTGLLSKLERNQLRVAPTFVFIDPFGYSHTPMRTIKRLMCHPKCEVLITFMYEEINRFLDADYTDKKAQYNGLFGTDEWQNIAASAANPKERMLHLHDLYQNQLKTVAGIRYVRSFRMRNRHNATDYFLFFGTNSLLGMDKMKDAMCRVDPSVAYDFSDFTNPDQLTLLRPEPDYGLLQTMIRRKFSGTVASVKEIENYIIAETPYCTSSFKTKVLRPMEKAALPQFTVVSSSPGRKMGQYPDENMRLRFP